MKTIQFIKKEIEKTQKETKSLRVYIPSEEKLINKNRKQVQFFNKCILYLETNPRPEFVQEMLSESERKISIFDRRLKDWKASCPPHILEKVQNPDKYYYESIAPDEKNEIKKTKLQLRTLKYLLT